MAPTHALTDVYKSALAEHVQANAEQGIERSQTEAELMEAFRMPSGKPRFTMQQIRAAVSWCLGPKLQERRRRDIEDVQAESRDHQSFTSPDKVESRTKAIAHLVEGVPREELAARNYLVLPSQYTDDYDLMAIEHDIPPENIAAYILPESPHASSRFIRNARDYDVTDRHVGDMVHLLPQREEGIHGGYIDFYGNYGRKPANVLSNIPVPANCSDMRFAINVQSSRESGKVHKLIRSVSELDQHDRYNMDSDDFVKINRQEREFDGDFSHARADSINILMFPKIGRSQEEHWLVERETVRRILHLAGKQKECDRGSAFDRIDMLEAVIGCVQESTMEQFRYTLERAGIPVDLSLMFMMAAKASGNTPAVQEIKKPHEYVSPNGNTPFMTCMATIETVRKEYEQCQESIDFMMKLTEMVMYVTPMVDDEPEVKQEKRSRGGAFRFDKSGYGQNANLTIDIGGMQAAVNIQNLQRDFEKLLFLCGTNPKVGYRDGEKSRQIATDWYMRQVRHRADHHAQSMKHAFLLDVQLGRNGPPANRNDRCPCCSGKKYKNCCKSEVDKILAAKRSEWN